MCRYAVYGPYKEKFACFHCRKSFKQTAREELAYKMRTGPDGKRLALCPECKRPMHDMGLDFRAPRRSDLSQWRKLELLHAHGITFHSCGCCGPGPRPATLQDTASFLDRIRANRAREERQRVKELRKARSSRVSTDRAR